jgi:type VI protein secretion system component Hcp
MGFLNDLTGAVQKRSAAMAVDVFLKLGDIKGESKDSKHAGEIEVLSWSWGVSQTGSMGHGGGGGAGKANFSDLSVMHQFDKASPNLMKAVRDRRAHQGSHAHRAQGRQGAAGVHHHQDERHHRHQRAAVG